MKKLMILGAGIYQVPLIKKANEMGLYTIAISPKGNYPGFSDADKAYYEDTRNYNSILEIAKAEKIDGICTSGTDVALVSLGKVVDEMGLAGVSYEGALNSVYKTKMKPKLLAGQVRSPKFKKVKTLEDAVTAFKHLKKPVIFKAVDSSGSRGIVRVEREEEIASGHSKVKSVTREDYFIVEEFIIGEEFGAQAFVYNGEVKYLLPHGDKVFNNGDAGVPIAHYAPYEISDTLLKDIKNQIELAIKALKFNYCAINADFIMNEDKTYLLEIGARAGATCLPEIINIHHGIDYYKQIIKVALGEVPEFKILANRACVGELLISDKTGIIKSIESKNIDSECLSVCFDYTPGDEIRQFRVGPDRIGQIIVQGDTLDLAYERLNRAKSKIRINFEDGNQIYG